MSSVVFVQWFSFLSFRSIQETELNVELQLLKEQQLSVNIGWMLYDRDLELEQQLCVNFVGILLTI